MSDKILFSYRDENVNIHHTLTEFPAPDKFPFRLHSHSMHEIYYFVGGNADYTVEGRTYPLTKGTLIFSAGGQVHHLTIKDDRVPYERIVLMFDISAPLLSSMIGTLENRSCVFTLNERQQIWFEESLSTISKDPLAPAEQKEAVYALITVMITKLSSLYKEHSLEDEPEDELVKQIVRFINRNLTAKISLETIEREFFLDKAHLNRRFRSVMGCGIWEYVIRKRIFNARQQLYMTENVSSAFIKSGFGDYSVFYRKYVRLTGVSPTADLKNMKKDKR